MVLDRPVLFIFQEARLKDETIILVIHSTVEIKKKNGSLLHM